MLVMSRHQGETILIGDDIEIVIAHIGRSRVKVGIRAPRQLLVIAREVKLTRDENLRAAGATASDVSGLLARLHPPVPLTPDEPGPSGIDRNPCIRQDAGAKSKIERNSK